MYEHKAILSQNKRTHRHSPQAYITRVKIHKAKQLLDKNPDMPLKEVAELSGYTDYSSFIRAFKNLEGITPTQYTRKIEE
ncbi:helix-turn-helix domain-containing protein [Capnocytophaga bilenii]